MLEKRFLGAMLGTAVGDAIGELAFEYLSLQALDEAVVSARELRYTDDTAMMIALAELICANGTIEPEHLGRVFHLHFMREPWRGYASGPPTVFGTVASTGISYVAAAQKLFNGQGSFGNGAAMRVAPVGLFYYDAPPEVLYEYARLSSIPTHAHPVGIDGAALLARAIALAVSLDPGEAFSPDRFLRSLLDFARTPVMRDRLRNLLGHLEDQSPPHVVAQAMGYGVAVQDSLPFALYAFLTAPRSFEGCLQCAVLYGGDRDTVGAMAGALAGAYLGVEAIPSPWLERLERREQIAQLARRLYRCKLGAGQASSDSTGS